MKIKKAFNWHPPPVYIHFIFVTALILFVIPFNTN